MFFNFLFSGACVFLAQSLLKNIFSVKKLRNEKVTNMILLHEVASFLGVDSIIMKSNS